MKIFFTRSTIKNAKWLPKKQTKIFIKDIKFLDKYLNRDTIHNNTKVIVWLNNGYANVNSQRNIIHHRDNEISVNESKLPDKLQVFINIRYSMIGSMNQYMQLLDA